MAQGKTAISKKKSNKSQGGVKKKLGRTKKGLKKQVKPKKSDQIISKTVCNILYFLFCSSEIIDLIITIALL